MNIATINDKDVVAARAKYREYRRAAAERKVSDYELLRDVYKSIARGRAVVNLAQVFATVSRFDNGAPKLALARATWSSVECYICIGEMRFSDGERSWSRSGRCEFLTRHGPNVTLPQWFRSPAPIIPPAIRPGETQLKDYHVLFEPVWSAVPNPDPLLLRHIRGDLYAVVAAWDMTEVERAVLSSR